MQKICTLFVFLFMLAGDQEKDKDFDPYAFHLVRFRNKDDAAIVVSNPDLLSGEELNKFCLFLNSDEASY
ncbi:MAG: hypothetical protein KGI50_05805 [Patescibacteria group bacterium]|nr:hypothetical protein [Patescibacteria group bacterium]MDE2438791.1 hypothetical protein [Patescibacteria group bacterium]